MRFSAYAGASFAVAVVTILHAWSTRVQYYPTVVFLTTNKLAQVALSNWCLVVTLAMGRLFRKIFLGQLRDVEVEVMYENARFAITETCLALTVFRSDITAGTFVFFTGLLFVKSFHWLAQARVEHLEQAGGQRTTAMARLASLLFLSLVVDGWMVNYCVEQVTLERPTVLILFAFEFAILAITATSTLVKFVLHVIDSNMPGAWHGKTTWTMLLEFFSEVFRFTFYFVFFMVMFTIYSVPPLHLVRDIWISFANIQRRLQALYRYRQLASNLEERFPDATEEELTECEHTCIICRDAMTSGKKLPCSHIFHFQCLRLWLQQQQACPTCRADIPTESTANAGAAAQARAAAGAAAGAAGAGPLAPVAVVGEDANAAEPLAGRAPVAIDPAGAGGGPIGVDVVGGVGGVGVGGAVDAMAGGVEMPHPVGGSGGVGTVSENVGMGFGGVGSGGGGVGLGGFGGGLMGGETWGGGMANGGMLPLGMALHAVVVVAHEGVAVRQTPEQSSPTTRHEPKDAVLLLMGPPAPCGSFQVYGGWVGGPGRRGEVRLVDIAQPQPPQRQVSADAASFPWMPTVAPSVGIARGVAGTGEEEKNPRDGLDDGAVTDDAPVAAGGVGGDGLRRRVVGGGDEGS